MVCGTDSDQTCAGLSRQKNDPWWAGEHPSEISHVHSCNPDFFLSVVCDRLSRYRAEEFHYSWISLAELQKRQSDSIKCAVFLLRYFLLRTGGRNSSKQWEHCTSTTSDWPTFRAPFSTNMARQTTSTIRHKSVSTDSFSASTSSTTCCQSSKGNVCKTLAQSRSFRTRILTPVTPSLELG